MADATKGSLFRTTSFPPTDHAALARAAMARLTRKRREDHDAARRGLDWTPSKPDPVADANYWRWPY